ncbi:MAG TPA: diguanylate cyclase [Longimicrobiaceae bacterium]
MQAFPAVRDPFRALVDTCPDAVLTLDGAGDVVYANPAAQRLLGHAPLRLPPALHPPHPSEVLLRTPSGSTVRVEVERAEYECGHERCTTVFLRDVTRRSGAERRLRTGHAVDRVLAEARSWEEAAPRVLAALCEGLEWEAGLLWEAEPDAPVLCHAATWIAPGARGEPLLEVSRRLVFLPGVGVPGRVWEERAPLWVPDLARGPAPTRAAGGTLRSVFAFPVLLGDEVFGVVELFTRDAPEPDAETRETLVAAGSGIGQYVLRKRNEAAVAAREKRFRSLIEYATDVITVADARARIRYVSPAVRRVLGYAPDDLLACELFALLHPEDLPQARNAFDLALRSPGVPIALECRIRHSDGSWRVMESTGRNLLHAPEVGGLVVNSRDVTARRGAEEETRRLSLTDELTGLYNRRGFLALAQQQLRLAQRTGRDVALLFADVDGLKPLNDCFGHTAGDRALVETAGILRQIFRDSDVIARVGGDEFVVLAPETSRRQGKAMTDRLQARVRERNAARGEGPELSLSVGVAWYDPARLCTVEALLAEADAAMYARKRRR